MRSNLPTASILRAASLLGAAALAVALTGCAQTDRADGGRLSKIQGDVSPELDTLALRPIDVDNRMFYTWDVNGRLLTEDIYTGLLLDRPSRLTNSPSPW
jgi:hypothetical protein